MPEVKSPEIPTSRPSELASSPINLRHRPILPQTSLENTLKGVSVSPNRDLPKALEPGHPNLVDKPFEPSADDVAKQVQKMRQEEEASKRLSLLEGEVSVDRGGGDVEQGFREARETGRLGEDIQVRVDPNEDSRVIHVGDSSGNEARMVLGQRGNKASWGEDIDLGDDSDEPAVPVAGAPAGPPPPSVPGNRPPAPPSPDSSGGRGAEGSVFPVVVRSPGEILLNGSERNGEGGREILWGREFEAEGIEIKRAIIRLESQEYRVTYADGGAELDGWVVKLKDWVGRKGKRSYLREPLSEPDDESVRRALEIRAEQRRAEELKQIDALVERGQSRQAREVAEIEPQDLEGLATPRELLMEYNALRDLRDRSLTYEQREAKIKEVEEHISRYFLEAKRLNLLNGVDGSLRMAYVDIMRGVYPPNGNRKLSEGEVKKILDENCMGAAELAEQAFLVKRRRNRGSRAEELARVEGVWDVYIELTREKLALLLDGETISGEEEEIRGEFRFGGESLEELNRIASDDTQLRRFMASDEQLRARAHDTFEDDPGEAEKEFARLVQRREETVRKATKDMEGSGARQAADLERYRQMQEDRVLFWKPTYANYFEVYARKPEEYRVVIDTFTEWIRNGVSKSPPELFQRVRGMVDALTTAGQRERTAVSADFIRECKEELEALIGVLGADYALERYNPQYFKQFMESVAQDTGPSRMLTLGRANRGKVAATIWKLDKDPRVELAFSSHLRRSQLMDDNSALEQEELQAEVENMLVFEVMAVELKAYDPRDPLKRLHGEYDDKEVRKDPFASNLNELLKFKPDSEFKNLFDGFDPKEQREILRRLNFSLDDLIGFQTMKERMSKRSQTPNSLEGEEGVFYADMQNKLNGFRMAEIQYIERLLRADRMQQLYLQGKFDASALKGMDQRMYEEARNAVSLAMEVYGVMGEKAKRGGAVIRVERDIQINGETVRIVDAIPMHHVEKMAHFAENWVRATYGAEDLDPEVIGKIRNERRQHPDYQKFEARLIMLDEELAGMSRNDPKRKGLEETRARIEGWLMPRGISAKELKHRVDHARRMAIWQVKAYGYDAKLFDFTMLHHGVPVDVNTIGYAKVKDGNMTIGVDRDEPEGSVDRYRYAVPEEPRYVGYIGRKDSNGKVTEGRPVILAFDPEGRLKPKFIDKDGGLHDLDQGLDYESGPNGEVILYQDSHQHHRLHIDNIRKNTRAEQQKLKRPLIPEWGIDYKTGLPIPATIRSVVGYTADGVALKVDVDNEGRPRIVNEAGEVQNLRYDTEGKFIAYDRPSQAGRTRVGIPINAGMRARVDQETGILVELAPVDLKTAIDHIWARWTSHAYWGYQEQDTELFNRAAPGALRIQRGISTPEMESPHAVQVAIADAAVTRTGNHPKQAIRDYINLAAVEESYQGHWRITDEIHQNFYPANADMALSGIEYNLQDFSGSMKMWQAGRALGMRWPDTLIRRYRTMLPVLMFHFASMAETWGAPSGGLDVLRMMGYEQYRLVGQFAFEKWIGQTEAIQDMFEANYGYASPQEKRDREGHGEKPNDDGDASQQEYATLDKHMLTSHEENLDNKYVNVIRKTRGRFETLNHRDRVLESGKRGERAPQWLEGLEVWQRNPDGSFKKMNGQRILNRGILGRRDSGSSRHSSTLFFWRDYSWWRSGRPGEGQSAYPDYVKYYRPMDDYTIESSSRFSQQVKDKMGSSGSTKKLVKQILEGEIDVPTEFRKAGVTVKLTTRAGWHLGKVAR